MRKLILIKHAKPQTEPDVPAHEWRLSEEGKRTCESIIPRLIPHAPDRFITSDEPKAMETGQILAERLEKPVESAPGLHEHDRSNVPMLATREFISLMALFFKEPRRLVLGRETADAAAQRFERAVATALQDHPSGNLAIVTHGTVLALFAAQRGAGEPFLLWRRMGLPSAIVFALPEYRLIEMIETVQPS
jgi:broad specificity phosphatase PhoE